MTPISDELDHDSGDSDEVHDLFDEDASKIWKTPGP